MEMRRFIIAAVPSLGFVLGYFAAVSFSATLSMVGSILCIASVIGLATLGMSRMKVRTKRQVVPFQITVDSKTYAVELSVIIKGTTLTRERFTTSDYWLSVIRLPSGQYESVEQVKLAIADHVSVATKAYNISVLHKYADLSTYVMSVKPERV